MDETYGSDGLDGWNDLCPGYTENPDGVLTAGNPGDFGKIICSCNRFYAGEDCEFSCTDGLSTDSSFLHVGGDPTFVQSNPNNIATFACSDKDNYCSLVPKDVGLTIRGDFPGGRLGFWMCGDTTLTNTLDINGNPTPALVQNPADRGTGFSLQGKVRPTPISRTYVDGNGQAVETFTQPANCTPGVNCFSAF